MNKAFKEWIEATDVRDITLESAFEAGEAINAEHKPASKKRLDGLPSPKNPPKIKNDNPRA